MFIHENGLTFRMADKADYSGVRDLMERVFDLQVRKENYEIYIADKNNQIIVAESGEGIAAITCIEKQWNAFADRNVLFIRYAAVDDNYRKRGIYTKINKIVWDIAKREGISSIELTCADFRKDSQRFYLGHGYTIKRTKVFIREIAPENP